MIVGLKVQGIDPAANFVHPNIGLNRFPEGGGEADWDAVVWQNGNGGVKPTWAELVAASYPQDYADAQAKEAARLAARPTRSAINNAKAQIAAATTIAGLRTGLASLVQVLEDTLTFQQVDVDEDV